jgi:hypothetical protein
LPKISFTIHSPTKLSAPSHLQLTKKEETAPKKPNSVKLIAAMSQIQETKTKVKDEKARLLSKIPSAMTTSTTDVVANFLCLWIWMYFLPMMSQLIKKKNSTSKIFMNDFVVY